MFDTADFALADEFTLTPVPSSTAALPTRLDAATEGLVVDLFFDAAVLAQRGLPQLRRAGIYSPWLRVGETRAPHLSSLDCGPCLVPPTGGLTVDGEPRWLRRGAFEDRVA